MSSLLKEKHALTKLKEKLKRRREKLCRKYKGFRYLAQNYRNKGKKKKERVTLQNKYEVLSSRVIQYRIEERITRRQEVVGIKYFKCGERGHKCRVCLLWKKRKRVACMVKLQKAH